jgi:hypothetical protein
MSTGATSTFFSRQLLPSIDIDIDKADWVAPPHTLE